MWVNTVKRWVRKFFRSSLDTVQEDVWVYMFSLWLIRHRLAKHPEVIPGETILQHVWCLDVVMGSLTSREPSVSRCWATSWWLQHVLARTESLGAGSYQRSGTSSCAPGRCSLNTSYSTVSPKRWYWPFFNSPFVVLHLCSQWIHCSGEE